MMDKRRKRREAPFFLVQLSFLLYFLVLRLKHRYMRMELEFSTPLGGRGRGRGVVITLDKGQSKEGSSLSSASLAPAQSRQGLLEEAYEDVRPPPPVGIGRGRGRPVTGKAKQLPEPGHVPGWSSFELSDIQSAVIELEPSVPLSTSPIVDEDFPLSSLYSGFGASSRPGIGKDAIYDYEDVKPDEDEFVKLTTEESMALLKVTNFGTIGFEKITGPKGGDPTFSGKVGPPEKQIDLMTEFREDAVLSPSPILKRFYCCICGFPAGKDAYTCYSRGHSTCVDCFSELGIYWCHYHHCKDGNGRRCYCRASLHQFPSVFRDFILDSTKVNCMNYMEGCEFQGLWEDVKGHQASCQYSATTAGRE